MQLSGHLNTLLYDALWRLLCRATHRGRPRKTGSKNEGAAMECRPFRLGYFGSIALMALREFTDEGEQRQVHCNYDRADGDAEEADQERFHERQKICDGSVDF